MTTQIKNDKENQDIQTIEPLFPAFASSHTISLYTSKYNFYNSPYLKSPKSLLKKKNKAQQPSFNNDINWNDFILIQIDNLTPNKKLETNQIFDRWNCPSF